MDEEPAIVFGPLKIWIHGRQFPSSTDFWDGNWINATAECEGAGSNVRIRGAFLHLSELREWSRAIESSQKNLQGKVELTPMEPELRVEFEAESGRRGRLKGKVAIRSGQLYGERHEYCFESDQSYLPGLLVQIAGVFRAYPLVGEEAGRKA